MPRRCRCGRTGSTAIRIISQRVEPRASAASSCSTGVCRKISRQMAVMIGMTMTASTMPAVRIVRPVLEASPENSGNQPMFVGQPLVQRLDGRGEHHDAPEAEDHRGDRGEEVDDVAERRGEPARGVVRDEEGDADRDRHGHQQRQDGRVDGAEEQRPDVVPEVRREERGVLARRGQRRDRLDEEEHRDGGERHQDHRAGEEGGSGEPAVAGPDLGLRLRPGAGASVVVMRVAFLTRSKGSGPGLPCGRPGPEGTTG